MDDIIIKKREKVNTVLQITFKNEMSQELGNVLPYPNNHYIDRVKCVYMWYLEGFFGTIKSRTFLNDMVARFLITYKEEILKTQYYPTEKKSQYKLKHFQNLKSKTIGIINKTNRFDSSKDFVFWCLKLYSEEIIIERGLIDYETLLGFGVENFYNKIDKSVKDFSTLKSKCKSIVNYYINRNYKLDRYQKKYNTKEEKELLKMTRQENMIKYNKEQSEKIKRDIKHFISGMFVEEYKKPNGKWNISKLSKSLRLSRPTIIKHLKELGEY